MAINRLVPYLFLNLDSPIRRLVKLSWLGVIVSCCSDFHLPRGQSCGIEGRRRSGPPDLLPPRCRKRCSSAGVGGGEGAPAGVGQRRARGGVLVVGRRPAPCNFADTHGDCKFSYAIRGKLQELYGTFLFQRRQASNARGCHNPLSSHCSLMMRQWRAFLLFGPSGTGVLLGESRCSGG